MLQAWQLALSKYSLHKHEQLKLALLAIMQRLQCPEPAAFLISRSHSCTCRQATQLQSCSQLGTLLLQIDYDTRQVQRIVQLHLAPMNVLAVHDGTCFSGGDDCRLRAWPLDFSHIALEASHDAAVTSVSIQDPTCILLACPWDSINAEVRVCIAPCQQVKHREHWQYTRSFAFFCPIMVLSFCDVLYDRR